MEENSGKIYISLGMKKKLIYFLTWYFVLNSSIPRYSIKKYSF